MEICGHYVDNKEFTERLLGDLPGGGISGDPVGDLYGEMLLGFFKNGKTEFNDDRYRKTHCA